MEENRLTIIRCHPDHVIEQMHIRAVEINEEAKKQGWKYVEINMPLVSAVGTDNGFVWHYFNTTIRYSQTAFTEKI